jgi:hypothetical protein
MRVSERATFFFFFSIQSYSCAHTSGRYTWERNRERERHTIILGHDDVDGDFHFRITSEEEQNIRGREKGDGSGSVKKN